MYEEETNAIKEKNIFLKVIENISLEETINGIFFGIVLIIVGIAIMGFIRLSLEHWGFIVPTILAGAGGYYICSQLLSSE